MTIAEIISWGTLSAVKILFAPSSMAFAPKLDYSFMEVLLTTSIGASIGVLIFYFLGSNIFKLFDRFRSNKVRSVFNKKNRKIVGIKMKFGLIGLSAFIGLLSVPITSFIVSIYYKNPIKAVPVLILSAVIWCTVLTSVSFGIKFFF